MKLLFYIIIPVFGFENTFIENIEIIKDLIKHYSIKNVQIFSEETTNLEIYVETLKFLDIPLSFNIHTHDGNVSSPDMSLVECCEFVLLTANNTVSLRAISSWEKSNYHQYAKLVIISFSNRVNNLDVPSLFWESQIIILEWNRFKVQRYRKFYNPVYNFRRIYFNRS